MVAKDFVLIQDWNNTMNGAFLWPCFFFNDKKSSQTKPILKQLKYSMEINNMAIYGKLDCLKQNHFWYSKF